MISTFVETTLYSIILETTVAVRTIDALHRQGYDDHFSLSDNQIISKKTGKIFLSGELIVDDILCCEEQGCEGFKIYAVRDPKDELKGILTLLLPPPIDQVGYQTTV